MLNRLMSNWVYGGALAGILLLCLAPLLVGTWSLPLILTFLHLPVYMLHQLEEHDDDRFRTFFNSKLGHGKEILQTGMVFIVNVPGVWGVIAVSLYLAANVHLGYALIAVYLVLVNAFVHIAAAIKLKCYNPGALTGAIVFVPFGAYSLHVINEAGGGAAEFQVIGFLSALVIHAAIIAYVKIRCKTLGVTFG
ncbi:MAG: HXXEE domain-containing protein [Deltaproteobacteria bacterium]|nr:HXXEE domain-containing protein [Deltaproteobacteria bacterium]